MNFNMFFICAKVTLLFFIAIDASEYYNTCPETKWSEWSECNNRGRQIRFKKHVSANSEGCGVLTEEKELDVDCQVSQWSAWGGNFGFGQQSRSRTITQRPAGAGDKCPKLEDVRYTGEVPSVNDTAKNIESNFIRPTGVKDLLIIMDCSGSITWEGFKKAISEISRLIGLLCPLNGPFDKRPTSLYQHNQAAMLTFSNTVHRTFDFDDYSTTAEIQKAIAGAPFFGGGTNTASAFRQAVSLFQPNKGARDESIVKRQVLILTDGRSNSRSQTLAAVKKLHKVANVYGLMTGTFSEHGMEELRAYVSSPTDKHLFYVKTLHDLTSVVDFIEDTKEAAGQNWCAPFPGK